MKASVYTFQSCETALQQVCEAPEATYEITDRCEWPGTEKRPRMSVVVTIDKDVSLAMSKAMKLHKFHQNKNSFMKWLIEYRKQEIDIELVGESEFAVGDILDIDTLAFCKQLSNSKKPPLI